MAGGGFEDFVVVVTGASTGLGRSIAVETARQGAKAVVINYARSQDEAEETARLVEAEGAKAVLVQGDVGILRRRLAKKIAAAAQPFDASTPSSTTPGPPSSLQPRRPRLPVPCAQDFLDLYAVNVVGAFQMVRACCALLEARPRSRALWSTPPRIAAASLGIGSSIAYIASKGALNDHDPVAGPRAGAEAIAAVSLWGSSTPLVHRARLRRGRRSTASGPTPRLDCCSGSPGAPRRYRRLRGLPGVEGLRHVIRSRDPTGRWRLAF